MNEIEIDRQDCCENLYSLNRLVFFEVMPLTEINIFLFIKESLEIV